MSRSGPESRIGSPASIATVTLNKEAIIEPCSERDRDIGSGKSLSRPLSASEKSVELCKGSVDIDAKESKPSESDLEKLVPVDVQEIVETSGAKGAALLKSTGHQFISIFCCSIDMN